MVGNRCPVIRSLTLGQDSRLLQYFLMMTSLLHNKQEQMKDSRLLNAGRLLLVHMRYKLVLVRMAAAPQHID